MNTSSFKLKPTIIGTFLLIVFVFLIIQSFDNEGLSTSSYTKNTYFEFIFNMIFVFISVSIISYGLNFNNKLSVIGGFFYNRIFVELFRKKNK